MAMCLSVAAVPCSVAIVTGASGGIGGAVASRLANQGSKVIVNYAGRAAAAEEVVSRIVAAGGMAIAVCADVSSAEGAKALFDAAEQNYGPATILVNNAGIAIYATIADMTDEDFDRQMRINVRGVFTTMREASTRLADGGRVINISSSVTRLAMPTYGPYSASKAAVEQMSKVFAKEVGKRGITVNSVSPGPTETPLFIAEKTEQQIAHLSSMAALGRLGQPEDIAKIVAMLCTPDAEWITGQNIGANGGFA